MTRAAIFDLDGTLLNTLGDLTAAVNHGLSVCGLPQHTEAEVRTYIGDGVRQLIARSCPPETDAAVQEAVLAAYLPYYAAHNKDLTVPYEGVTEMLHTLRSQGVKIAVVSNKHDPGVQALCAHYFGGLLDLAVGADGTRPLKPAPDSLLYAMEKLGVSPEETWFVGDSVMDVQTAHAAGVRCVAVAWGFQDRDRLAAENPAVLTDCPQQVTETVLKG